MQIPFLRSSGGPVLRICPAILTGVFYLLCAASWWYLWMMERDMPGMANAIYTVPWSLPFGMMVLGMWVVMMVAMMIPALLPMLWVVARLQASPQCSAERRMTAFALGYLLIWTSLGAVLTGAQWLLNGLLVEHDIQLALSSVFGAAVLIAAGVYQWSPWKDACLRHCQTPVGFLLSHWRDGGLGGARMGLDHGLFCLGCCWMLMILMLVGGAMHIVWMSAIAVYLLLERILPSRFVLQRVSGSLLIAVGAGLLAWGRLGSP